MEYFEYLIGDLSREPFGSEEVESSREIIDVIKTNLLAMHDQDGLFCLTNIGLGGHNTIFDRSGELLAVIDTDSFRFAPIEVAALPPGGVGLDLFPDSRTEKEIWREGTELGIRYLKEYAQLLSQAGKDFGNAELGDKFSKQLLKDSTVLVVGLFQLDKHDLLGNSEWLNCEAIQKLKPLESEKFTTDTLCVALEDIAADSNFAKIVASENDKSSKNGVSRADSPASTSFESSKLT